ncbi:MAG: hypothetical protein WC421_05670 [Elusimicrobiales bacterium]
MNNKLLELAKRAGATESETKALLGGGFFALCAAVAAVLLSGCAGGKAKKTDAQQQPSKQEAAPVAPQSATPEKDDGPWPGYPTGTRYNTVSPLDFA